MSYQFVNRATGHNVTYSGPASTAFNFTCDSDSPFVINGDFNVNGDTTFTGLVTVNGISQFNNSVTVDASITANIFYGSGEGLTNVPMAANVAYTNSDNNFSTNQTVTGTVIATLFSGSGASLTSLPAAQISGTINPLLARNLVEANNAGIGSPNVLTAAESRTVLTNEGAVAENYHTLPTAAAGYDYNFVCQDADGIRVTAASGDTIRVATGVSATAGFIKSTVVGSTVRLKSINATEWVAVEMTGTWTIDGTTTYANPLSNNAANSILPSQSGHADKVLSTNGTTVSWQPLAPLNQPYNVLAGEPPPPYSTSWLPWAEQLRSRRLANVPSERTTTYYFSQAGDDTTGNGSFVTPWKTLAKAQATLTASSGDIRLRFKGGETWRENQTLNCTKNNVTVDSYGTGGKAKFTLFIHQYTTGWNNDSGNRWSRSEANAIGWVREGADGTYPFTHIYSRQTSSAAVSSTEYSFYHDGATLYINPGNAVNPNSLTGGFEAAPFVGGWGFSGDNNRIENIILHGLGMSNPSTANYGLSLGSATDDCEYVCVGVEVLYTGYHAIGCASTNANYMWVENCRVGLCTRNNVGETVFVAFSANGGHECVWWDCEMAHGTLPDSGWTGTQRGLPYYSHTNVSTGPALVLAVRTRYPDNDWQVGDGAIAADNLTGTPEGCRAVIYGEQPECDYAPVSLGATGNYGLAVVNGIYNLPTWDATPGTYVAVFSGANEVLLYNCEFTIDASAANQFGVGFSWFWGNGSPMTPIVEHCRFNMVRPTADLACITYYPGESPEESIFRNCIFTWLGTSSGAIAAGHADMDSDNLRHCAYYAEDGDSLASIAGDTLNPVTLTEAPTGPTPDDGMLAGAGEATLLQFDRRGILRTGVPDIGPLVATGGPGSGSDPVTVSPSQLAGDVNNYAPDAGTIYRLSSDASRTISGWVAGEAGVALTIFNVGGNNVVFSHQSGSSSEANRIITPTGASFTLYPSERADMVYDGTTTRWRIS